MIRKLRNQKEIPTQKNEVGKNLINSQLLILGKHIVSCFPNRRPLIYQNLTKICNYETSRKHVRVMY